MQTKSTKAKGTKARGTKAGDSRGFSLIELMVALGVTMVIMVVAGRMLAMSLNVRMRENQRTEAIADVQRALQMMTREIANAGLGLSTNGLSSDSPNETVYGELRVRSNLNAFEETTPATDDTDEDVVYTLINNNTGDEPQRLITRQDVNLPGQISQLANRVDALRFDFFKADGTGTTPAEADKVRITVTVNLPAVGSPQQAGYQPSTRMQLASEATLRNRLLAL